MFNKYRLSDFRCYVKTLQKIKDSSELNRIFSKEIDKICSKEHKFTTLTSNLKNASFWNQSKTQEISKILSSLQSIIDDKRTQFKRKHSKYLKNQTNFFKWAPISAAAVVSNQDGKVESVINSIPEPPPVPVQTETVQEVVSQVNALGEPTFASLGLGGYSPIGIVQNCLEYLHVSLGIEWWAAIAIGTLVIRLLLFPLVVIAQRNAARMNNCMPQMQLLQLKMTEARQTGNVIETARYSQELMVFMKQKGLNPFKNMIVPLAQMPVFVSCFVGLRQMANVPVESLSHGGMFWFTDLTVPDQFFILPVITSLTLWATIELGTDAAKLSSQNLQTMKYVLRAIPLIILPFTVNFPGVILCYWVASNFISLGQVAFLRIPAVRDYFKIDKLIAFSPENLPVKPKGFTEGLKDSWSNIKITKELEERRRVDELQFQRAGKGPIVKTYKYDPTKQSGAISAKKM